jgi:hypothetical protein
MNMYETLLKEAERRDPGNTFVASCRAFLEKNSFLSKKQIKALENVTLTRAYNRVGRRRHYDDSTVFGCSVDEFYGMGAWE